jgi:hypothetical protein
MFYMTKLFISSFLNRNNKEYFKQDKGYWLWNSGEPLLWVIYILARDNHKQRRF